MAAFKKGHSVRIYIQLPSLLTLYTIYIPTPLYAVPYFTPQVCSSHDVILLEMFSQNL